MIVSHFQVIMFDARSKIGSISQKVIENWICFTDSGDNVLGKVTAFIRRNRNKIELLFFKYPTSGILIASGTMEFGRELPVTRIREERIFPQVEISWNTMNLQKKST
ncbi:hypothetical protein [Kosmotoga sp. DU53]|uniref:hypothetical protein n=1 Tax=Kosmotoga sp. DU53 TaxID=1310160 RepID=UPI001372DA8B|nr:hypothetical protein [Kosmotoga sp. DU53]